MFVFKKAIFFISLVFSTLVGTELALRIMGEVPESDIAAFNPSQFSMKPPFEPDPLTGWRLKSGSFQLDLAGRKKLSQVTIGSDGSRSTGKFEAYGVPEPLEVIFIGDSYTFGEGLDDNETMPWKVQERLAKLRVLNHGVPGYGTCQSWLRLRQVLSKDRGPIAIIYGFSDFHESRSIADPRMDYWAALRNPLYQSGHPRCSIEGASLIVAAPREWSLLLPLTRFSVLSKYLSNIWLNHLADSSNARVISETLLKEMHTLSQKSGATFVVLLQDLSTIAFDHYRSFFDEYQIKYIDGRARLGDLNMRLPDGHPGPEINAIWGEQVANTINSELNRS